jgi:flagellin
MTYINYNYAANLAANAIGRNDRALDSAMNRISTGSRVGNGNSELGMFGQYIEFKSDAVVARQGVESLNRGLAQMKLIESQATVLSEILVRMHELASVASNVDIRSTDRYALDGEFMALGVEANRITTETTWNGSTIMQGTDITIDTLTGGGVILELDDFRFDQNAANGDGIASGAVAAATAASAAGTTAAINVNTTTAAATPVPKTGLTTITTQATAALALAQLDIRVPTYAGAVSRLGGQIRTVEFAADALAATAVAMEAATAGIRDADYAVETAKLASAQVISQAATAMVAQANARSTSVLALLQ